MGAYDRFKNADPMGVRSYILAGKHVLLVKRTDQSMSKHPNRKGQEKTVVEFKIIESDTMKVGESVSLVETEASQGYFGNVLAFTAGILGMGIDEMKNDPDFDVIFEGAYGKEQILVGMLVKCVAQQVPTTSSTAKSEVYTAKTFEPVLATDYGKWNLIAPNGSYAGPQDAAA